MKTKTFKFISTTDHGYLVVPNEIIKPYIQELIDTQKLADVEYSFWNKKSCQLEEDVEAYKFLEWYTDRTGIETKIKESHQENIRKCRPLKWVAELDVADKSNWIL